MPVESIRRGGRKGAHEGEELLTPHTLNAQGSRRVLYPACIRGFTLLGRIGVIRLFI